VHEDDPQLPILYMKESAETSLPLFGSESVPTKIPDPTINPMEANNKKHITTYAKIAHPFHLPI
jgi:hypothetical protein